ncbi:MAG: cobyric acid synthase [Thermoplasmataceae archaeon]
MVTKLIMVVGTASGSGKSTLVMSLCRIFRDKGFRVAPFKAINISVNSVVTQDGSEISRAQWLQAKASRTESESEMNPFLIKPEPNGKLQLIQRGKSLGSMSYDDMHEFMKKNAKHSIKESINHLSKKFDIIIIEGSGSPAEINREGEDYANSFILREYSPEAILITDIEYGGAFAALYGTYLLTDGRESIRWMIINRMRGNQDVLGKGLEKLKSLTGTDFLGIIPMLEDIQLPGEDTLDYLHSRSFGTDVCIIRYPWMENLSETDPLVSFGIGYFYLNAGTESLINSAKVIILPGSKDVISDLKYIRERGFDRVLVNSIQKGVKIIGICGGYQMLGKSIEFQEDETGNKEKMVGLGLLDVDFKYFKEKKLTNNKIRLSRSIINDGEETCGYEIHYGQVTKNNERNLFETEEGYEGSLNISGNVMGTNIHGCLENRTLLNSLLGVTVAQTYEANLEKEISRVSNIVGKSIDIQKLISFQKRGN